jgi:hypothetical protein
MNFKALIEGPILDSSTGATLGYFFNIGIFCFYHYT